MGQGVALDPCGLGTENAIMNQAEPPTSETFLEGRLNHFYDETASSMQDLRATLMEVPSPGAGWQTESKHPGRRHLRKKSDQLPKVLICYPLITILLFMGQQATAETTVTSEVIVEMLISRDPAKQVKATALLQREQPHLVSALLAELSSADMKIVGAAAFELAALHSPWVRGRDSSARFIQFTNIYDSRRPVERPVKAEQMGRIRTALLETILRVYQLADASPEDAWRYTVTLQCLTLALTEFAGDPEIDWLMKIIATTKSPYLAEVLFPVIEGHIGNPPLFRAGGICGNSSPAEVKQLMKEEAELLSNAIKELSAKWRETRALSEGDRIKKSIKTWREKIFPVMRQYSGSYFHIGWLGDDMWPLIRMGEAALPHLREQRSKEDDLGGRAVWDFVIASITGETDDETVRALMQGSDPQREMACEIIAASGQRRWAVDLERLKMFNGFHLGKASSALAALLVYDAIPILERLSAANPSESESKYALQELKARLEQGEPRRRQGYRRN